VSELDELARGVIVAGIRAAELDPAMPVFGAYVLFNDPGAPIETVRALSDALRARQIDAPLIAIDQEGGAVARLRQGVETMPPMMALGAADDLDLTRRAGEQLAFDLRRAGCTLDFAPVLDLALDPRNTVIGTRSFGSDPLRVAALGQSLATGLLAGGISPCFKHFPGHGATATDSHEALPFVDCSEGELRARDLVPFAAVAAKAPAMMNAHVVARAFDSERPATLSARIATSLLRDELAFRGALFTDCLEMGALAELQDDDVAVAALAAGVDLLVFSHRPDRALRAAEAIADAVAGGRLPLRRLEEANARAQTLRHAGNAPIALDEFPPHPDLGREIARRAITLVRGIAHADPIVSIAVSFGGDTTLVRESPALAHIALSLDPAAEEVEQLLAELERRGRRPLVLSRRAHLHPAQAATISRILAAYPDATVVSLREPFDLPLFGAARHLLAAYGDDVASLGGLADVLFSGHMPAGRLPISSLQRDVAL